MIIYMNFIIAYMVIKLEHF